jgi:Dual-action HEIGH metallo-peptidase
MNKTSLLLACAFLGTGCIDDQSETDEIVENLVKAGFPADDIQVVDGKVYTGNDALVTLATSREMLEHDGAATVDLDTIQYTTNNLVSPSVHTICVFDLMGNSTLSAGLDIAISRYNALGLSFTLKKGFVGCDAQINAVWDFGPGGGVSGFPSNGLPYNTIHIQGATANYGLPVAAHVIEHELGHTIGFRHSDFYDRSISCGGDHANEGDGGVGANLVPGTPAGAVLNGSVMNACFNTGSNGVFTASDVTALTTIY